jgi:nucleoside-diphosphate-sugar epimerase
MRHPVIEEDLRDIYAFDLPWSAFHGKTVLVTGANGFLPAYMVETLLYANEKVPRHQATRVIGLVRNLERARQRFEAYRTRADLELICHDVSRPLPWLGRTDFIVHAASQASPKYYGSDPVGTLSANVLGTHHLLSQARENNCQGFLFFSSAEIYGKADGQRQTIGECDYGIIDPLTIRSCYAESKRMGETMCASWWHQFRVPTRIVRPAHIYGPGMRLDDGRVFADFVSDVVHERPIVMKSDGTARRAFCYLADATKAFFTVLLKGENGNAYNVANDQESLMISELAQLLVHLFPGLGLHVQRQERTTKDSYLPSKIDHDGVPGIDKMRELGWRPTTGAAKGFARTVLSHKVVLPDKEVRLNEFLGTKSSGPGTLGCPIEREQLVLESSMSHATPPDDEVAGDHRLLREPGH